MPESPLSGAASGQTLLLPHWAQTLALLLLVPRCLRCLGGLGATAATFLGGVPRCSLASDSKAWVGTADWGSQSSPCTPVARAAGKTSAILPDSVGGKSPKLGKGVQRCRGSQRDRRTGSMLLPALIGRVTLHVPLSCALSYSHVHTHMFLLLSLPHPLTTIM